jgi:hypothetical protein
MREPATKREDLFDDLVARPMRNVQRRARPVDEPLHPIDAMPCEPFMQLLTAHPEAVGELGDRVRS